MLEKAGAFTPATVREMNELQYLCFISALILPLVVVQTLLMERVTLWNTLTTRSVLWNLRLVANAIIGFSGHWIFTVPKYTKCRD